MFRRRSGWRARRRQQSLSLALDERRRGGRFGVGFFGFLENSRFWHSEFGRYYRIARIRRLIIWLGTLIAAAILLWIVIESIRAFPLL